MPNKPKRQKKYTSREMVIKDIDAATRKMNRLLRKAEGEDAAADLMFSESNVEGNKHRDEADRLRKQAERIKRTRLPKLQRVLAAIDTKTLGLAGFEQPQATLEKLL